MAFSVRQPKYEVIVKILLITLSVLIGVGCRDKPKKYIVPYPATDAEVGKLGGSNEEVRKVSIAARIEPFMNVSVTEKWSRRTWIEKFGQPLRDHNTGSGVEYLEYVEPGPYKPSGRRLITGVVVGLKDGVTLACEWHYTTFGLPGD